MKEACAVTGASGYVGSRVAARLAGEFEVVSVGRAGEIRWAFGEPVKEALRVRAVKVLVHVAWDLEDAKGSVEGSRRLIEEAVAAGVRRIVFISTISAFVGARSAYGRAKLRVEEMVLRVGGTVVRPGLVWGETPGGMFGGIRKRVSRGGVVPVVGDGRWPQYLVYEDDLAEVVEMAALGMFGARTLTVAHPRAWMLRELILRLAAEQGAKVRLVGVPWRIVYAGLKAAEMMGVKTGFRPDSVISLVHQDRTPAFSREVSVREFV